MRNFAPENEQTNTILQMKLTKLFGLAALCLALASCGDDEEVTPDYSVPGGTGVWTTTVAGATYAKDTVNVTLENVGDDKVRITIDEVTGRPATETMPAQMMTGVVLENITSTKQADGSYILRAETLEGGGTMRETFSSFMQGNFEGTIEGKKLTFTVNYKFTASPYEPNLSSSYVGTFN